MKYLDLSLRDAFEDVALDEALLDWAEEESGEEVLRVWEPGETFVVAGLGNILRNEVNVDACERLGIPVVRRCTGGGAVVQGPGCLSYALVLKMDEARETGTVTGTNSSVMRRHLRACGALLGSGRREVKGHTDLAIDDRKFSGNAQRRRRKFLLFHGTFLLRLDVELMGSLLKTPGIAPEYRAGRTHEEFVRNLEVSAEAVKSALREGWGATESLADPPLERMRALALGKYRQRWWTEKR